MLTVKYQINNNIYCLLIHYQKITFNCQQANDIDVCSCCNSSSSFRQLPSARLNREETKNKFVYLTVNFDGLYSEERILMVTFHSGYIFIQTDRPIYNPGDSGERSGCSK